MSGSSLVESIAINLRAAVTQALDLSFNELLDMHENEELNIAPDYQRLFRWTEGQRSRFIESLLLELPVPPIYVIEEESGSYVLIDGLQRISSYLHLRGKLNAPYLDPPVNKGDYLTMSDCDIVEALNGLTYSDMPTALQIRLKRAFIRVEVIRKESDKQFKYHMFKRLNTGGERLSDQQMRNCTIRLLSDEFPDFIIRLSGNEEFADCVSIVTQSQKLAAFDQELVLRFFALKNYRNSFKHDVSDFLTDYMERVVNGITVFDYASEEAVFLKTFGILQKTLGSRSFGFPNKKRDDITGGFGAYHFEAITIGLQVIIDRLDPNDSDMMEKLEATLLSAKLAPDFVAMTTGGGKNSPGPLARRIGFVEEALKNAFP